MEKLELGPTVDKPGPMLLKFAATAEKLVAKSKLSRLTSSTDTAKSGHKESDMHSANAGRGVPALFPRI